MQRPGELAAAPGAALGPVPSRRPRPARAAMAGRTACHPRPAGTDCTDALL